MKSVVNPACPWCLAWRKQLKVKGPVLRLGTCLSVYVLNYNFQSVQLIQKQHYQLRAEVRQRTYIGSSFLRGLSLSRRRFPERDKSKTVSVFMCVTNPYKSVKLYLLTDKQTWAFCCRHRPTHGVEDKALACSIANRVKIIWLRTSAWGQLVFRLRPAKYQQAAPPCCLLHSSLPYFHSPFPPLLHLGGKHKGTDSL